MSYHTQTEADIQAEIKAIEAEIMLILDIAYEQGLFWIDELEKEVQ